ncbi:MAG: hypothetical protein U5J78_03300 [Parasphingorhabdus sp.]|nr:hypothetical protein [Parasphingorhabdus sp.]
MMWKLVVAFTAITAFSVVISRDPFVSLNRFFVVQLNWVMIFFVSAYIFSVPGRLTRFIYVILGLTFLICMIAIWEWRLQRIPWAGHIPSFLAVGDESVQRILNPERVGRAATGVYRVQSKFTTPLGLAEHLGIMVPFVLHLVMTARQLFVRVLMLAFIPLIFFVIMLTDSRLGMVGFFVSFLLYAFVWGWRRWRDDRKSLFGPAVIISYPVTSLAFFLSTLFIKRLSVMIWGTGAMLRATTRVRPQYAEGIQLILVPGHGVLGLAKAVEALGFTNAAGDLDDRLLLSRGRPGSWALSAFVCILGC